MKNSLSLSLLLCSLTRFALFRFVLRTVLVPVYRAIHQRQRASRPLAVLLSLD